MPVSARPPLAWRYGRKRAGLIFGVENGILYALAGAVAALMLVLGLQLHNAPDKTTGIAIAFGKSGLVVENRRE